MTDEVLFRRSGRLGIITLNRPQVLNALNRAMCGRIHRRLFEWAADPDVGAVLIEGAGDRAFCAGGDVAAVRAAVLDGEAGHLFFHDEYRLNQAIAAFPKPWIAILDGITMGGGIGLSAHGRFRVATERTLFAMPETAIGFIPDVGTSHILSRYPGEYGTWLALTGARLGPADCRTIGYATHFVPSADIALLVERLADSDQPFEQILDTFDSHPGRDSVTALRDVIDYAFSHNEVEDILDLLDEGDDWAKEQAATLRRMSPTSLKLTLHAQRTGRHASLQECLRMEYRMAVQLTKAHDFFEGVRAQLVDKDRNPRWQPAALADVDIGPYLQKQDVDDLDFS